MSLSYKQFHLTKTWIITIFCGILLLGYIITWLLVGDMNLLHQQWLIPNGGILWKGVVTSGTSGNYIWVFNTYKDVIQHWNPQIITADDFLAYANGLAGNRLSINAYLLNFNYLILLPIFCLLFVAIIIPLIFRIFKWMEIDVLPFSISIGFVGISFVLTGLIPTSDKISVWIWVGRFAIMIFTFLVSFFFLNSIVNYFIALSNLGEQAIIDISASEREHNEIRKDLKELQKEQRKSDSLTFIDV